MNAFFSGTDDANENMTQFYGVWGNVDKEEPSFAFRYVSGKAKIECDPSILFDWPRAKYSAKTTTTTIVRKEERIEVIGGAVELLDAEQNILEKVSEDEKPSEVLVEQEALIKGPFKMLAYPDDWFAQHKKEVYAYQAYGKSFRGRGYNPNGAEWDEYWGEYWGQGNGSGYYAEEYKRTAKKHGSEDDISLEAEDRARRFADRYDLNEEDDDEDAYIGLPYTQEEIDGMIADACEIIPEKGDLTPQLKSFILTVAKQIIENQYR